MTYAYGLHGAPAVGGGLPGLPVRKFSQNELGAKFSQDPPGDAWVALDGTSWDRRLAGVGVAAVYSPANSFAFNSSYGSSSAGKPAISKDGDYVFLMQLGARLLYKNGENSYTSLWAAGNTNHQSGRSAVFTSDKTRAVYVNANTPFLHSFSLSGASAAKKPNANVIPDGAAWGVAISPDDQHVAVVQNANAGGDILRIYSLGADGVLTHLQAIAVAGSGAGRAVAYSEDSRFLYVGVNAAPFLVVFERTSSGYVRAADPDTLPSNTIASMSLSKDGRHIAVSSNLGGFSIYRAVAGELKFLETVSLPANVMAMSYNGAGNMLAVAYAASPFIGFYKRSDDGYQRLTDFVGVLPQYVRGIGFSPNDELMVASHDDTARYTAFNGIKPLLFDSDGYYFFDTGVSND